MQVDDLQGKVADFVRQHDLQASIPHRLLDLISEAGELCKEVLKSTEYGRQPFIKTKALEQELGDLFFSLLCAANSTGVDLEAAIQATLIRYEQRVHDHGGPGSGA